MPEDSTELILAFMKEHDQKRNAQIKGLHKNMEAGFDAFNIKLDAMNKKQHEVAEAVKGIKKDTTVWRWMHRNPKLTFIAAGIVFAGITAIFGHIDKETIGSLVKKFIGL